MLELKIDYRIGGKPRYYIADEAEKLMQIPDEVRKSVVFVYCRNKDGELLKAGTAFLAFLRSDDGVNGFNYIITAKHVIIGIRTHSADGKVILRANKASGGESVFVDSNVGDWKFHPTEDNVDVAVLAASLSQDVFDTLPIEINLMALNDSMIEDEDIGVGDEVFMTGLFVNHTGKKRILPIVRAGNIALMPEEKVHTKDLGDIDAYLIEARSIKGLSGSPVFVYLEPIREKNGQFKIPFGAPFNLYFWMGLIHGHWDLPVSELDATLDSGTDKDKVNMGIAIVVPTSKIMEVINQPIFMKERKKQESEWKKRNLPTADFAPIETKKEEFEKALKQVSRKVKSEKPDRAKPKT